MSWFSLEEKVAAVLAELNRHVRIWKRHVINHQEFCHSTIITLLYVGEDTSSRVIDKLDSDIRLILREYCSGLSEKDIHGLSSAFVLPAAPEQERLSIHRRIQAQLLQLINKL